MQKPKLCREVREYYYHSDVEEYIVHKYGSASVVRRVISKYNQGNGTCNTICEEDIQWEKDEDQREVLMFLMDEFGEGEVGEREVTLYYWW